MLNVKTLDPSGDTHRHVSHTDVDRLAAHARVERDCARDEYGALPPRLRLVVLTVSVFGSFGRPALAFFAELSRRTGGAVPPPLLPSATWAAPRLAPFARMAVSTAVRRGLATAVWSGWARAPAYVPAPPAPVHVHVPPPQLHAAPPPHAPAPHAPPPHVAPLVAVRA